MTANQTKALDKPETAPKVLLYDLETSPNISFTWGKYDQNVIDFVEERQIISFAWKWLDEKETHVLALPDFSTYKKDKRNNKALIKKLHSLFHSADIVVGHNVIQFDDRRANSDFLKHGLTPPPPHRQVDTLLVARNRFDLNSNKLGDLGKLLGLGEKEKHPGFPMWRGCLEGDPKSWALMKKYNRQDVVLLEKIYLKLRPWMSRHPHMGATDGALFACPGCQSKKVQRRGWRVTAAGRKMQFQCQECGKWSIGQFIKHQFKMK